MNPFFYMPFMQGMNFQNNQNNAGFNPFDCNNMAQNPFFRMWQMPFPFPNPAEENNDGKETAESAEGKSKEQNQNPFDGQMTQFIEMMKAMGQKWGMNPNCMSFMPGMDQCQDFFRKMWQMPNMNFQSMNPYFNPWAYYQASMEWYMEMTKELIKMAAPLVEMLKDAFKGDNGMPFGIPAEALRFLLNMDSTPDGLSKFQKILDIIFDLYLQQSVAPKNKCEESSNETCTENAESSDCAEPAEAEDGTASCDNAKAEPSLDEILNDPDIPPFVKRMIKAKGSTSFGGHGISYYIQKYGKK